MPTQSIEHITVEVDGTGDSVIMIHGLGGTSNTWTPQMSLFVDGYQSVRPDLPGAGRTPPGTFVSIETLVECVSDIARSLGIRNAHVLGHSMGTIVCQHLAVANPSLVRSLALFGPLLEPPAPARQALRDRAALARREGMAEIADSVVQSGTSRETKERQPATVALVREIMMRQPGEGYAQNCDALANAQAADLSQITCPVLLMTGDEDVVAPPATARTMEQKLERVRTVILPRCGHWTTFECPREVNRELQGFLRTIHLCGHSRTHT